MIFQRLDFAEKKSSPPKSAAVWAPPLGKLEPWVWTRQKSGSRSQGRGRENRCLIAALMSPLRAMRYVTRAPQRAEQITQTRGMATTAK